MQKPKRTRLNIAQINPHYDLQPRMAIDQSVVEEYREAIVRGDQMPPVTVFFDRIYYYLVDGFHRLDAAKGAGLSEIDAEIIDGDFRAAKLFSLGVNSSHGLKRSSADKRKACLEMLGDAEWAAWSNVAIAKHLKVDDKTVAKYRDEAAENHPRNSEDDSGDVPAAALLESVTGDRPRTVERNGMVYEQKTANLGPRAHESAADLVAQTDAVAIKPPFRAGSDEQSSAADSTPVDDDEMLIEMNALRDQVTALNRELDSMRTTDHGAEIERLTKMLINEENKRKTAEDRRDTYNKELKWFGSAFVQLRKLLNAKYDRDVVAAVRLLTEVEK